MRDPHYMIRCVLLYCAVALDLFLSLKFPLATGVVVSCLIRCVISSHYIVPVFFLSLKCPLTTGVIIYCHYYWCRCLDAPDIANYTYLNITKVLYLPQ